MEDLTPLGSQENRNLGTAISANGEEPTSSPVLPISGSQNSSKPRKAPTITPRSFTRFFTPKSSLERGGRIGASRQALRDITATASNRRRQRSQAKNSIELLEEGINDEADVLKRPKRKRSAPKEITPDRSSPLKRICNQSLEIFEDSSDAEFEEEEGRVPHRGNRCFKVVDPFLASGYRSGLGRDLRREIGVYGRIRKARSLNQGFGGLKDWQGETANFFSRPEDIHICHNVAVPTDHTIPFCTASCNSEYHGMVCFRLVANDDLAANSLVAVGDEDGGVRLLESSEDEKPGFSKAYLTFRPHANAILDLAFSPDDLLLATASGDQTSHIIDMPTQRATTILSGHSSSVKQVCFQPGSSNVMATSSRDGSVQIWDLRCKGFDAPVRAIKVPLDPAANGVPTSQVNDKMTWGRSVNSIMEAHQRHQAAQSHLPATGLKSMPSIDPPSKTETPGRRGDVSITALQFLGPGLEHLLITASEADAGVKLWDLRTTHTHRRYRATPLSSTRATGAHMRHRHFGLTSLSLSGDGARLYTVCRDNTVYAYSTTHLILGHAPELSSNKSKPRRSGAPEKDGLGPIYGFRHPKFHASSFYVKGAVRPAKNDKTELLAVGSSNGCAVVFPTDEKYMHHSGDNRVRAEDDPFRWNNPARRRSTLRLEDSIPIYHHGSALIRGHNREVTGMNWTVNGELMTVGDDYTVRCWREGARARDLRLGGEDEGRRWGCGWAEADAEWDEEDG